MVATGGTAIPGRPVQRTETKITAQSMADNYDQTVRVVNQQANKRGSLS